MNKYVYWQGGLHQVQCGVGCERDLEHSTAVETYSMGSALLSVR